MALVLKKVHSPTKLGVRLEGPYTIECVNVIDILTILLCDGVLNILTYSGFCRIVEPFSLTPTVHKDDLYQRFCKLFDSYHFSPPNHLRNGMVELFQKDSICLIHSRALFAMEGQSALQMHISCFCIQEEVCLEVSKRAYLRYV